MGKILRWVGAAFLVIAGLGLVVANEIRSVIRGSDLAGGRGRAVAVDANRVDRANDGKLVHLTGELTAAADVADPETGVRRPVAMLRRFVQVQEWRAEGRRSSSSAIERKEGFELVWSAEQRDPMDLVAEGLRVGAYPVSDDVAKKLGTQRVAEWKEVGEMKRVRYEEVPLGTVTVVGEQRDGKLGPGLLIVRRGTHSVREAFDREGTGNDSLTWMMRLMGMGLVAGGIVLAVTTLTGVSFKS